MSDQKAAYVDYSLRKLLLKAPESLFSFAICR